jgi:hypothetical protein
MELPLVIGLSFSGDGYHMDRRRYKSATANKSCCNHAGLEPNARQVKRDRPVVAVFFVTAATTS